MTYGHSTPISGSRDAPDAVWSYESARSPSPLRSAVCGQPTRSSCLHAHSLAKGTAFFVVARGIVSSSCFGVGNQPRTGQRVTAWLSGLGVAQSHCKTCRKMSWKPRGLMSHRLRPSSRARACTSKLGYQALSGVGKPCWVLSSCIPVSH